MLDYGLIYPSRRFRTEVYINNNSMKLYEIESKHLENSQTKQWHHTGKNIANIFYFIVEIGDKQH